MKNGAIKIALNFLYEMAWISRSVGAYSYKSVSTFRLLACWLVCLCVVIPNFNCSRAFVFIPLSSVDRKQTHCTRDNNYNGPIISCCYCLYDVFLLARKRARPLLFVEHIFIDSST